jgi:hypothetical protein
VVPHTLLALAYHHHAVHRLRNVQVERWRRTTPWFACLLACSDLHPFHEREKGIAKGCITGHEFVGHVVAKGAQVRAYMRVPHVHVQGVREGAGGHAHVQGVEREQGRYCSWFCHCSFLLYQMCYNAATPSI